MVEWIARGVKRVRWGGIVLGAAISVLLFAATGISQGACYDSSDPTASYCTSGTVIPHAAVPYLWAAYGLLAAALTYRSVRPLSPR